MPAKFHVKKGDEVVVITGEHKGKIGKILQVLRKKERVIVEGIRLITKAVKPTQKSPQGGLVQREGPIHISNVKLTGGAEPKKADKAASAEKAPAKKAAKKKAAK